MVERPRFDPKAMGALLSQVLRELRLFRRKRPTQVAIEMGMPPRSYEHFEAGRGRLNVERIHLFASRLGVDPYGIFASLEIGSPAFAVRTAENQVTEQAAQRRR